MNRFGRTVTTRKKRKPTYNPKELLLVQSKVKDYARKLGLKIGPEGLGAISDKLESIIKDAAERAKLDGKGTIKQRHV